MNRTRFAAVRGACGRKLRLLLLLCVWSPCVRPAAAANPGSSPYYGEPVITSEGILAGGGGPQPGPGALTFAVDGLRSGGNSADLDPYFQVPGGGAGIMARIGHVAGHTLGRDDSLTHINLQPYVFVEENMLFTDFRMYRLNDGGVGGNVGVGWRRYFEEHDAILGGVVYYDSDDTRHQKFEQLGVSLEMLSRWLDVRANYYMPFGETEQILGTRLVPMSQRFVENFLLVDTITSFSNAADGFDLTLTSPVPWHMLQPYNVEASAGFYHYQVPDVKLPKIWGYRLRVDASFFERVLHTFVELTSDRQYETNVIFGASLDYYHGFENRCRVKDRQYYRMSEWVRRNYNVVTIDSDVLNAGVPVINPADGEPYFFAHIANNPPVPGLMDGTFENPFEFINQAFMDAPQADVFLVHGGSLFTADDATVIVPEGKILLGENVPGRPQTLPSPGLGMVELPAARPGAGPVVLLNSSGTAIDATNALLVGAFTIVDPTGNGLLVSGPSALMTQQLFRDISIFGADGDGVLFDNAQGNFRLQRVRVAANDTFNGVAGDGAMGVAFHVLGGNATIVATDDDNDVLTAPTFENSGNNQNEVILIQNTTGGLVDLTQTSANDHGGAFAAGLTDGGGGIRLLNNAGNVTLGAALIENTVVVPADLNTPAGVGAGVQITGTSGNTTLFGDIDVVNASGVGFLVSDLAATGSVNVSGMANITVDNRNDIGADFRNITGQVLFNPMLPNSTTTASSLTIGPLSTATNTLEPAIRFSASSGLVSINDINVANSNAEGILIGDYRDGVSQNAATARFIATGNTTLNNTGMALIQNGPAIRIQGELIDDGTLLGLNGAPEAAIVDFRDAVTINQRVGRGVQIVNTTGRIQFSGTTTVNNNAAPQSPFSALHIRDTISTISFANFISQNTIPGEPAVEIRDIPRPGAVGFGNLVINNAQGEGADLPGGDGNPALGLPADTTGLLVLNVNSFSTADGFIDVQDGIAVDIENVFPQDAQGRRIVFDNQNRPVVVDAQNNPLFILDASGNPILDQNGNPVVPNIFTLRRVPGYQVQLTEVNAIATSAATAQLFGIVLLNNTGTFEVTGVDTVFGSGGEINGSIASGLFADNADRVTIRHQDYLDNEIGLVFQNMNESQIQGFVLDTLRVQDSRQEAVRALNVRNITIVDSQFQNNGTVDQNPAAQAELFRDTIFIAVSEVPDDPFEPGDEGNPGLFPYTYRIERNTFLDNVGTTGADGVRIITSAGFARGSLLTLFFRDNNFLSFDRGVNVTLAPDDFASLLSVNWNGTIDALISNNVANMVNRNGIRAFEILQRSNDDNNSQVVLTNNSLNFNNSSNSVGAFFDFVGTARIDATLNAFDIGNGGGTAGLAFRLLGQNNDVEITGNVFDFGLIAPNVGSGVGVDVLQVVAPSSFLIENNVIGTSAANAANIGFRFQTIIGQIQLFGTLQNTVFANTFFTPLNSPNILGQININGVFVP